jgi:hypothetical protein
VTLKWNMVEKGRGWVTGTCMVCKSKFQLAIIRVRPIGEQKQIRANYEKIIGLCGSYVFKWAVA